MMKPLSSFTYIKNNPKKVLPSFICTIISVFLIYLLGLLLYGSVDDFCKTGVNLARNSTFIFSNNPNNPISEKIIKEIKEDDSVSDIIPMLGMSNHFNYQAAFGNTGTNSFNFYSEDLEKVLKNLNLKLVEGTLPRNNSNEILLPQELAKQFKLKVGDYINNESNEGIRVSKTYKLVGLTQGDVWIPIVCDVGEISSEKAMGLGLVYFFEDNSMALNDKITALKVKNVVIQEYNSIKSEMDELISSMDVLYAALCILIITVLCISLGNLNYIVFLNRLNEFGILSTIGFSKSRLRRKIFKENLIVCLVGYVLGIGLTTLIVQLLNLAYWNPNGQHVPIFRMDSMLISLIIPIFVSLFSMISSVREFNKLEVTVIN